MRAVKDDLPVPFGEVEESECARSTAAVEPTRVPFPWKKTNELNGMGIGACLIFCARATRGLRRPSLDARSGKRLCQAAL